MRNIESIRNGLKDSRKEALSQMISIRRKRKKERKDLNPRTTKMVVISVVNPVTLQKIAKLRKPLSL